MEMSIDPELEKIKKEMLKKMMNATPCQTILKDGEVVELIDANFHKALSETDKPVLVDFWAEWCAPCKMMAPVIHQLAKSYAGKIHFAKLNVDQNRLTAAQYGVMSIPNFILFKNNKPIGQTIGAVGRPGLEALIRRGL